MLLAVDMGNTQTALGLFDGDDLVHSWRMPTDRTFTADEVHMRLEGYFRMSNLDLSQVKAIAFAGVVPELSREWHAVAARLTATPVGVGTQAPHDSSDRCVAPEPFSGAPAIVVDFGTATNIDVIDSEGYYIGGSIAPGIRISMDALTARASKLASVPLESPAHAIGKNTIECVQSGAVIGAAAMAEGLVARIKNELGAPDARVIATGGLSSVVAQSTDVFDVIDNQLTLRGIREIYRRMTE